eukprot:1149102-Pelagomonas_calceolata.AAC.6
MDGIILLKWMEPMCWNGRDRFHSGAVKGCKGSLQETSQTDKPAIGMRCTDVRTEMQSGESRRREHLRLINAGEKLTNETGGETYLQITARHAVQGRHTQRQLTKET